MKTALAAMFAVLATACTTQTPGIIDRAVLNDAQMIRLYESPCYFPTCVSYDIELRADGRYTLTLHPSGQPDVISRGLLGGGIWTRAEAAFTEASFTTMDTDLTVSKLNRPGGVPCIHDLPDVTFTRRPANGEEKTVRYSTGCNVPAARKLLDDLRTLMPRKELERRPAN